MSGINMYTVMCRDSHRIRVQLGLLQTQQGCALRRRGCPLLWQRNYLVTHLYKPGICCQRQQGSRIVLHRPPARLLQLQPGRMGERRVTVYIKISYQLAHFLVS